MRSLTEPLKHFQLISIAFYTNDLRCRVHSSGNINRACGRAFHQLATLAAERMKTIKTINEDETRGRPHGKERPRRIKVNWQCLPTPTAAPAQTIATPRGGFRQR